MSNDDQQSAMAASQPCLACGYDAGRADAEACPECGTPFDHRYQKVIAARNSANFDLHRHIGAWAGVIIAYAAGMGVIGQNAGLSVIGAIVLTIAVLASALIGWLVSRLAPRHHRRFVLIAWSRGLGWMHGPWLIVSVGAIVIMGVAFIDKRMEFNGALVNWMSLAGFSLWLLLGFIFLYFAFSTSFSSLDRTWPNWVAGRARLAFVFGLAIFVIMFGSVIVGVAGGAFAAGQAYQFAFYP